MKKEAKEKKRNEMKKKIQIKYYINNEQWEFSNSIE